MALTKLTTSSITGDTLAAGDIAADAITASELADNAVDTAAVADNAVTLAKMASGTDGNIISYDASGNPVAIATGNDGMVLTSTGAGSPPAFEAVAASVSLTAIPTGSAGSPSLAHAGDTDTGIYFATNQINFATAGNNRVELLADGNLSIRQESLKFETANKGVYLGTTSGAAANLLNDYEEGTWTPSWSAGGGSLTGTSNNYGKYTKIGDMVSLWFGATIDSGTASGYYRITNAPFTSTTNGSGSYVSSQSGHMGTVWWDSGGTTVNMSKYDATLETDPNLKVNIIMKV